MTREANMAKITASVEDDAILEQEAQQDQELDPNLSPQDKVQLEKLKQAQLKTQMAINRLEKAKEAATSDTVKAKLQEEIDATKQRKLELEEARKTQLAEASKQLGTVKTASNLVGTGAKVASDVRSSVDDTVGKVRETAGNIAGTLETITTPGTIYLPITILLIFFFLLLPVNGMTRAQWLWLSLVGDAQIQPSNSTPQEQPSGQGGGGEPEAARTYTFTRG